MRSLSGRLLVITLFGIAIVAALAGCGGSDHKITIGTPTEIDAHEILTMATIAENAAYQELRAEA